MTINEIGTALSELASPDRMRKYAEHFLDMVNPDRWDGTGNMPDSVYPYGEMSISFGGEFPCLDVWFEQDTEGCWIVCHEGDGLQQCSSQIINNVGELAVQMAATVGAIQCPCGAVAKW